MATFSELKERFAKAPEFCQKELWSKVDRVNREHKIDASELKEQFRLAVFPLAGGFLMTFFNFGLAPYLMWGLYAAAAILLWPAFLRFMTQVGRFSAARSALKSEIKELTLKYLDPDLVFAARPAFPADLYRDCGLFPESYDRTYAQDHCAGRVGETRYELVEVAVHEVRKSRSSKGLSKTTLVPIFCGLLFKADFNKNFSGHTTIRPDFAEQTFGYLARSAQRLISAGGRMDLVELENPEFEKKFKVQSTDPVQARYILTPEFMERILEFERRFPSMQLAFRNGALTVAIPRSAPFLELKLGFSNLTSSVTGLMTDLIEILQIVEELKLNERIWNKVGA